MLGACPALTFLVPSLAIATGTQLGERLATRLGTRTTLLVGFLTGTVGTVVLALGFHDGSGYPAIVPGLVISGVGQGVTWTAMWIAAVAGVAPRGQGVASGMAPQAAGDDVLEPAERHAV